MVNEELRELLDGFVAESIDSLDDNEIKIGNLENEDNQDDLKSIFRVFHTLKGLSGFFELNIINKVTHNAENLLDLFRENPRPIEQDTVDLLYVIFDFLQASIVSAGENYTDEDFSDQADELMNLINLKAEEFKNTLNQIRSEDSSKSPESDIELRQESREGQEVNFNEDTSSIKTSKLANEIDTINELFTNLKKSKDISITKNIVEKIELARREEEIRDNKELQEILESLLMILDALGEGSVEPEDDIFLIIESDLKILSEISNSDNSDNQENDIHTEENQDISIELDDDSNNAIPNHNIQQVPQQSKPDTISTTSKPQSKIKKDLRVSTEKIDQLFNLVGEIITIETMLFNNKDLQGLELPNFNITASMLSKLTRELQEVTMSIRMIPLEGLFNKMNRLVRDISRKMKKEVEIDIYGQETEMDKNVIEEISDPLVHMLRNAIDHGIETAEERITKDKDKVGRIKLGAAYQGNEIHITVEDDGAGLNREKILQKAIDKGIVSKEQWDMPDAQVWQLIFEAGLSTAKQVTDISGRGVGMDVVRRNIEKLRGSIEVESRKNIGTKITFKIPLTLAIMDAMILRVGKEKYAMPILSIIESFQIKNTNVSKTMDGLEIVRVRGELYPVARLSELMKVSPDYTNLEEGILLKVQSNDKTICIFVDEILEQSQAVVKPLSSYIGEIEGVTGCMVMPDGKIGLILDADTLITKAEKISENLFEIENV